MMMNAQEVEEMKKWEELLNESKEVTDQKTVEFNLANAEKHEEYWIYLQIEKHTGTEQCKGNCKPTINGAFIGVYTFNVDFTTRWDASYHIWTKPVNVLEMSKGTNSIQYNTVQTARQVEQIGNEIGTGKFTLEFPANYTGKITAKILGRQEVINKCTQNYKMEY